MWDLLELSTEEWASILPMTDEEKIWVLVAIKMQIKRLKDVADRSGDCPDINWFFSESIVGLQLVYERLKKAPYMNVIQLQAGYSKHLCPKCGRPVL